MPKKMIKSLLLMLFLALSISFVQAKRVPGYIITQNSDTIYGKIKLSKFDLERGTWIITGVFKEQLHYEVCFRENNKRWFKNYQAANISGFGFTLRSQEYHYKSFTIKSNTRVIADLTRERFLQLIYKGDLELYRDLKRTVGDDYMLKMQVYQPFNVEPTTMGATDTRLTYYELYLYNEDEGLTKVEVTKEIKTVKHLLSKYGLDEEFLEKIPRKTKFKDINIVLKDYYLWKKSKKCKVDHSKEV